MIPFISLQGYAIVSLLVFGPVSVFSQDTSGPATESPAETQTPQQPSAPPTPAPSTTTTTTTLPTTTTTAAPTGE